jgi:ketosteroid isomerase-like protein
MNVQQELVAAENLVTEYAEAVNAADRHKIASLYSEDGLFMPAGMRSLTKDDITKKGKQKGGNIHFRMS